MTTPHVSCSIIASKVTALLSALRKEIKILDSNAGYLSSQAIQSYYQKNAIYGLLGTGVNYTRIDCLTTSMDDDTVVEEPTKTNVDEEYDHQHQPHQQHQ